MKDETETKPRKGEKYLDVPYILLAVAFFTGSRNLEQAQTGFVEWLAASNGCAYGSKDYTICRPDLSLLRREIWRFCFFFLLRRQAKHV